MTPVCSIDHLPHMLKALSLFYPQHHKVFDLRGGSMGKSTSLVSLQTEFHPLDLHSRRELATSCPLTAISLLMTCVPHIPHFIPINSINKNQGEKPHINTPEQPVICVP